MLQCQLAEEKTESEITMETDNSFKSLVAKLHNIDTGVESNESIAGPATSEKNAMKKILESMDQVKGDQAAKTSKPSSDGSQPHPFQGKLVGETEQMSEATREETALQSTINKMMVAAEQTVKMLEKSRTSIDSVGGDSSYIDNAVAKAKDLASALEQVERGVFGHMDMED